MMTTVGIISTAFIILYVIIGIWSARTARKSIDEYLAAGRRIGMLVGGFALYAAFCSAMVYVGLPGMTYSLGLNATWQITLGAALGFGLLYFLLAEPVRRFAQFTLVDYLAARYNHLAIRILVALFICGIFTFAIVPQIIGAGLMIGNTFGVSLRTGEIIFAVVLLLYVSIGGMRAVTFSDAFQGIIMFIPLMVVGLLAIAYFGGITPMIAQAAQNNPKIVEPTLPLVSYLGLVFGIALGQSSAAHIIMRISSAASPPVARTTVVVGVVLAVLMYFLASNILGIAAWAVSPGLSKPDNALWAVMEKIIPQWLFGWIIAGLVAAAISTASAMLMGSVASLVSDIYYRVLNPNASPGELYWRGIVITWALGVAAVLVSLFASQQVSWFVAIQSQALGATFFFPLVLGIWWKRTTTAGAISGMVGGLGSFILFTALKILPLYGPVVPAIIISLCLTVLISLLTQPPPVEVVEACCTKLHQRE
ncbi:MAG: hypothetical protein D9V47_05035 [Clostridia bacterium]|nr:MAG: hypothetical protein D9V47_05035 [Clostridia bacterium]